VTVTLFWIFAGAAIVSAMLCVTRPNPVVSALWLVVTLFSLAGLFVILDAQFLAVLQVLVYAGAIMVLFLFVIMLLNLGRSEAPERRSRPGIALAVAVGGAFLTLLAAIWSARPPEAVKMPEGTMSALQSAQGAVGVVAEPLYRTYLIPFELTSILLLAAIVGAVVLAKKRL
jgi:NADH-quinone oxidoreductase subunit J